MTDIGDIVDIYPPHLQAEVIAPPTTLDRRYFSKKGDPTKHLREIHEKLKELLAPYEGVVGCYVGGSVSRGKRHANDLDLVVFIPEFGYVQGTHTNTMGLVEYYDNCILSFTERINKSFKGYYRRHDPEKKPPIEIIIKTRRAHINSPIFGQFDEDVGSQTGRPKGQVYDLNNGMWLKFLDWKE